MEKDTVSISRESLEALLDAHVNATELLEQIPQLLDEGRSREASQHIGAELEARTDLLQDVEKREYVVEKILDELVNRDSNTQDTTLEDLEQEFFG
jgi:hypothetical protein